MSSAVLFGDLQRAYYSVLVELVTGPLLTPEERQVVLANTSMDELRRLTLEVDLSQGHCLFDHLPLPQDLKAAVREWLRLAWFSVEGSPLFFVHNIGVKPGDPSADVLFAFVFFCFHARLKEELRDEGLLETVEARGANILPEEVEGRSTEVGVPPYMDDLFIPLSDPDPVQLIERTIRAAQILDKVAKAFGFVIQYGPGKTEATIVFRGPGKSEAQRILRNCEKHDRVPHLPLGGDQFLRVVAGYKHLGALASASMRFAPEVSARVNAASAIEKSLSKAILMQSRLPRVVRVNVATAIHSALLYAAATWPQLSAPQRKKFAVRYYSPLRKAVDGHWVPDVQSRPISWDEVLYRAKRPTFEAALAAARLRFLARLPRAPVAVFALLQVAGGAWRDMVQADLTWLRTALGSAVASLPAPAVSLQPWLDVAGAHPLQWKQLVKRFVAKVVAEHAAQHEMGVRTVFADLMPASEEPIACPVCPRILGSRRALEMHCRRAHGRRCPARFFVLGSVCPVCGADFVTRPRAIGHLMRGALACVLQWRLGALPAFPDQLVQEADEADRVARRAARRVGGVPGIGIPYIPL